MQRPDVAGLFDPATGSIQYIVSDPITRRCAIVDPVLDFDETSGTTSTANADRLLGMVAERGLTPDWIIDTHPHADHLSATHYLKGKTGAVTATGAPVVRVQKLWADFYGLPDLPTDGSQWDRLLENGERFTIGDINAEVLLTPGHTPASITILAGDAAFIHDTLFMPDGGTARVDFPGGNAHELWASIQTILSLPEDTRLFTGHDYRPNGREPRWESSVAEQKAHNIHLTATRSEEEFVAFRKQRDAGLSMPKLLLHALQVNIDGGKLPEPDAAGRRHLRIPLNALDALIRG